ncbi:hypothetical protein C922_02595 [Plasmodium inui San Antonio 1]|uniref:Uncharacterized protein n=1 Tax=Plasmodium inui San Antonio 1 TaxID=1237626 RepID=W7ANV0_9APIC|nr:hypothetical protein C922_02595 [Plasmodium inui San Antonio 1]EUD67011.1 hypothetical protein C922_02595 [Plasmodium inui San Antonio 1]
MSDNLKILKREVSAHRMGRHNCGSSSMVEESFLEQHRPRCRMKRQKEQEEEEEKKMKTL